MPKFEKWSLEMKNYMAGLRAKRGEKSPIYTNKQVSKGHIKEIVNEALEKYYLVSTPVIEVPSQVVKVDKPWNGKLIDTLFFEEIAQTYVKFSLNGILKLGDCAQGQIIKNYINQL